MLTNLHCHTVLADLALAKLRLCWFWKMWSSQESIWNKLSVSCLAVHVCVGAEVLSLAQSALCRLLLFLQHLPAELQMLLRHASVTTQNR